MLSLGEHRRSSIILKVDYHGPRRRIQKLKQVVARALCGFNPKYDDLVIIIYGELFEHETIIVPVNSSTASEIA